MGKRGSGIVYREIGVKLPLPLYEKLADYAYRHKRTISDVVRAALSMYLQEQLPGQEPEELSEDKQEEKEQDSPPTIKDLMESRKMLEEAEKEKKPVELPKEVSFDEQVKKYKAVFSVFDPLWLVETAKKEKDEAARKAILELLEEKRGSLKPDEARIVEDFLRGLKSDNTEEGEE